MSHAGALRLQVGARTLATIPRRLVRFGLSLDAALAGQMPVLPPLGDAHGYRITSLPDTVAGCGLLPNRLLRHVQQRYVRRWTDLTIGHDAWLAGLERRPASTLVVVTGFTRPELLVEVEVTAARVDGQAPRI